MRQVSVALAALMTGLVIWSGACQGDRSKATRTYSADGRVVAISPDRQSVTIQHGDIQGFMPAMTMSFLVKDPALLTGLAPNDLIRFELTVTPQEAWVSRIEKTGHADKTEGVKGRMGERENGGKGEWDSHSPTLPLSHSPPAPPHPLTPGQAVPDFTLTDQDGRRVSLEDFRGRPVAITFIFTRCPLPEYCPRFTNNFASVQNQIASRFKDQFHLLSISIDPAYDTPKVLKEYGRRNGADFHTWSLLVGPEGEVRKVAGACGVSFWNEDGMVSHTSACAVVTPSGTLYKLYQGNTWTPEQIISDITTLLTQPHPTLRE